MEDSPGVRFPPPLIPGFFLAAALVLQRTVTLPAPPARLAVILAIACGSLATALGLWSFCLLIACHVNPMPHRPTRALILRGPYRLTRNPIYLAMVLLYVAIGLPYAAAWTVILAGPLAVVFERRVILREERYLQAKFGAEYAAYRARVRRWL